MNKSLPDSRHEYRRDTLHRAAMHPDPLQQLQRWLADCREAGLSEWNAMNLATVTADGRPASRMVLLKGVEEGALVFFSNYHSRKGRELEANPEVALTFWWQPLERQVRVEGHAHPIAESDSDAYFQSRPRGSRLGALASPQSRVIADYRELEQTLAALEKKYPEDDPIPRPHHWGGYRITPHHIEFWQGRPNRLHDRILYHRQANHSWVMERLAP